MEDPLIFFQSLLQGGKEKRASLHFNLVSLNTKTDSNSMTVEGHKLRKSIYIFGHIWPINLNTRSINKFVKNERG